MRRYCATLIGGLAVLYGVAAVAPAQEPPATIQSQPAARAEVDPQRIADLVNLIEGPNSPQARQTGVRELLRLGASDTIRRLAAILSGSNNAARVAIATVLADTPENLDSNYADPIISMLATRDGGVAAAARRAIAAFSEPLVIPRLRDYAMDAGAPAAGRVEAIGVLGEMTHRDAAGALVAALRLPDPALAKAAFAALRSAVGQEFEDVATAEAWWDSVKSLKLEDWLARQTKRLMERSRSAKTALSATESRLVRALRDGYVRTAESERGALLQSYLTDSLVAVRVLALELVQTSISEAKTPPPDTVASIRALMSDPDAGVREAAVRTVGALRDAADGERFLALLPAEKNTGVRQALAAGLGYVGATSAVEVLTKLVEADGDPAGPEAVAALGRFGERGILDAAASESIVSLFLRKYDETAADEATLRERLLWAMSRFPDPRCAAIFAKALGPAEPVVVRQAAARGIGVLNDPAALEALVPALSDADVSVRRTVVETLGQRASTDSQLAALWTRLVPANEPDESIRDIAWRGVSRMLASHSGREIDAWIGKLPENGNSRPRRTLELLQLEERAYASNPAQREDLGLVRQRLGATREKLGAPVEAVDDYRRAVEDLRAVRSPRAVAATADLIRAAVLAEKYDDSILAPLHEPPLLDATAVWKALKTDLDALLARDPAGIDQACAVLSAIAATPPLSFDVKLRSEVDAAKRAARAQRATSDSGRVQSAINLLHSNADDVEARSTIERLGRRAAPCLQATLRSLVTAEGGDATFERLIHDLLKAVRPDWTGYSVTSERAAKLQAIDGLSIEEY